MTTKKCPRCGDPRGDQGGLLCQANGCLLVDAEPRDAEITRLKAEVAVRDGSWCEQNRKEGRGGCGMCAWCCKDAREQRDALALDLAAHKRALAAGPAALRRAEMTLYRWDAAEVVEAAQEAAMKEGT